MSLGDISGHEINKRRNVIMVIELAPQAKLANTWTSAIDQRRLSNIKPALSLVGYLI